ncbi:hypothetical protein MAR_034097 [Mya arenaria]|uniref:Uncharacterized protein n=1 Tax=Mya arenaria TaxID=6604 RepID=A0ABY7GAV4_MYAAR|nr:hypothetical protein MAR_034097 [Mya arenaria]
MSSRYGGQLSWLHQSAVSS